ncbi:putative ABC transporter substrate-binding lipoprotein YvgL [Gottschalkia purinilytica]|uniref:Putative ABC transporter substrate-binding lipoprotein YvgL n=1 Tax=Gottschalkia purinilytica TaxID=1503 RepID=A0A0L0WAF0_GOTPU|nr:molybdate ABC transporter substrate-binding protein [Gottschalkia purinilytica]KNF08300.1 putative ABC transporter substrate-binding lipoprotein YvgL [Gottschalkia purinilytica]
MKIKMKSMLLILTILLSTLSFAGCSKAKEQTPDKTSKEPSKTITVSAAASLKESLDEIQKDFEKEKGIKLTFNFGSSGALQKQIEEGAPADVFISAGKKQMDALEEDNLIDKDTRKDLLGNKLVLIVPNEYKDKIKSIDDLANSSEKISLGETESVPVGQYSKDALTYLKLWDKFTDRIVFAKDVKQVVSYVEKGEVAGGIVYNSDATVIKDSFIAQTFGEDTHKPIVYPEAVISSSKDKESAKTFLEYLDTKKSKEIFEKYGFVVK